MVLDQLKRAMAAAVKLIELGAVGVHLNLLLAGAVIHNLLRNSAPVNLVLHTKLCECSFLNIFKILFYFYF